MSYEITNTLRSASIIRVVDAGTYSISLANLSATAAETVNTASIKRVMWSTNGSITIARNGVNVLSLYNSGDMRFSDYGHTVANSSNQALTITVASGGTAIIEVAKDTTYSPALIG